MVCQRSNDEHWAYFPQLREEIRHQGRLHVARDNLDRKLVELRPDVVHFGYGTLAHGRTHVGQAAGCGIVTSFRGYDLNSFRLDEPGCYDEVWEQTDVVHAVSDAIWQRAVQRGCPGDQEHRVITDAVDVAFFSPPERRPETVGSAERPLRLLTVGRLHWKKGHEQALAAVRTVVDRGIEVEHRIVGEGEHREPTQFAIDDLGLGDRVQLLGARSALEVRDLLAWADVLVHPSLTEAFGVAVIEAQAMGLPVVCSDAGGLPENVEHGVTGFVVARRDHVTIAERLVQLAADPQLRCTMGAAARQRAETVLGLERQLDGFEAIYEEVLERRAAATPVLAGDVAVREERAGALRRELDELETRREAVRLALWRREVVDHVHAFARDQLPGGASVLVVSRGDEEVVALPGVRAGHFPQSADGAYAGHHPADSADAIDQLEELRRGGAEYLLVPATSGWWLEHYGELAAHLEADHERLEHRDEHLVAFRLRAASAVTA